MPSYLGSLSRWRYYLFVVFRSTYGWLILAVGILTTPVLGQDRLEEASAWFRQGELAFRQGNARAAADAFEQAHLLIPHGATVYNAGLAWEAAGENARAVTAYKEALDRGDLSSDQANDAQIRMKKLLPSVGQVRIVAPEGAIVEVAYVQGATPPITLHLPLGEHRIEVLLPDGERLGKTVEVTSGSQEVVIRPSSAPSALEESVRSEGASRRTFGWVAIGGASVLSGAAIYLGLEALEARDRFNDSGHTDVEAHDRAASMRLWTNVAWAGAGASAITGAVLLLGASEKESVSTGGSQLRVGASGVSWSGSF